MNKPKPIDCFPTWLDTSEEKQIEELEEYFRTKKIELPETSGTENSERVIALIEHCGPLFSDSTLQSQDLEGVFFSIASLFCLIPVEKVSEVVNTFADQILSEETQKDKNAPIKMRILNLFYIHFENGDPHKFGLLIKRVNYAVHFKLGMLLNADQSKAAQWVKQCRCTPPQKRELYKALWEVYHLNHRSLAAAFLGESVKTLTDEDAASGAELTRLSITEALMDKQQYVFDDLLNLPAMKAIAAEPLHELLKIFVSGKLTDFKAFLVKNSQLFDSTGLDVQVLTKKMQLLTLTSMATTRSEIDFSLVERELDIEPASVDSTVIEAVCLKLMTAKVDQINKKIVVSGSTVRQFGPEQWKEIHDKLSIFRKNLNSIRNRFESITNLKS